MEKDIISPPHLKVVLQFFKCLLISDQKNSSSLFIDNCTVEEVVAFKAQLGTAHHMESIHLVYYTILRSFHKPLKHDMVKNLSHLGLIIFRNSDKNKVIQYAYKGFSEHI